LRSIAEADALLSAESVAVTGLKKEKKWLQDELEEARAANIRFFTASNRGLWALCLVTEAAVG
jgi:hypothetical protein